MIRVNATLTGISPLLMNPASEELIEQLRTKTPAQRNRDLSPEQEAGKKLYVDGEGIIGIPTTNLLASLVEAGRDVDLPGRKKISTASSTRLYAFMSIDDQFLRFPAKCQSWVPDKRRGRNPNGGEMVALCRPRFDSWSLNFVVEINEDLIDESKIRELFNIAGRSVGLCDFRPSCRGPFGRSKVTAWDRLDDNVDMSTNGHKELASVS